LHLKQFKGRIANLNVAKLGFIHKFWPKRFRKIDSSWDDHSESVTPATTPDDEEAETFVPASKPRTKVKPKQEEALTTEKEHVNVVFIGHVGKKTGAQGPMLWFLKYFRKKNLQKIAVMFYLKQRLIM
jgi:hypothetical protein